LIDADDPDRDRISARPLELALLVSQVGHHAINLFDHRLRQYLDLASDLDGGNWAARNYEARYLIATA
jgi:hypothetical protein